MNRFKVGDLVTGNELNNYALANALATCKVIRICNEVLMEVVILKHPSFKGDTGFVVASRKFKLVKPKFKGNN